MKETPIIISLGGSLMVPDEIDVSFFKAFVDLIQKHVKQGKRFVVITGGGKTARRYMDAAIDLGFSHEETDWMGIHATRINGELLKCFFGKLAHSVLCIDPSEITNWTEPVLVGAGWKPGWSSDYDAVESARVFGANKIVNLSNVKHVYDKDPRKHADAVKIEKISWDEYLKIIPEKWTSGLNSPFDPIASREAQKENISVAILSGDLSNFDEYLNGKPFVGTVIS